MLKLRRGGGRRRSPDGRRGRRGAPRADRSLIGEVTEGDEADRQRRVRRPRAGLRRFGVVHVNLTRGLAVGGATGDQHVIKLNYTSLQHPVAPVEGRLGEETAAAPAPPVLILPLHGHLAPACWAAGQLRPGLRVGYVQTAGGALPGSLSRDVAELRERGLLTGHVTAGSAYGGEHEAIGPVGALDAAARRLGWQAIVCGPGPGILGSALPTVTAAWRRSTAPTPRSPWTFRPCCRRAFPAPTHVPATAGSATTPRRCSSCCWPRCGSRFRSSTSRAGRPAAMASMRSTCRASWTPCTGRATTATTWRSSRWISRPYPASRLPTVAMGRTIAQDPLFFAAALAGGGALAGAVRVQG